MALITYQGKTPKIAADVFVAEGARVIGDVEIAAGASVWFNTVIRGDVHYIRIGKNTNVQDMSVVHVAAGQYPTLIGDDVTIGHRSLVHACIVGHRCMIGMGSVIMDGAVIGDDSIVAAGSLVLEGKEFPPGSVIMGSPAKRVRDIRDEERVWIGKSARDYFALAQTHRKEK